MRKFGHSFLVLFFIIIISITGCNSDSTSGDNEDNSKISNDSVSSTDQSSLVETVSDNDSTEVDTVIDSTDATKIFLSDNSTIINGAGATVEGNKILISSSGTYFLTGSLTNGQVVINTQDEGTVKVVFNGAMISCASNSPFYVLNAHLSEIILADNTENFVSDGSSYVFEDSSSDEPNAAIFSKDDLVICGTGTLNVNGKYIDGIASKDGLTILGGTINVNSVDDGIRGKDFIDIKAGNITVAATGDGLKSDNSEDTTLGYISVESGNINVTAGADAFDAETYVAVAGGTMNISSGGGSSASISSDLSAKGIKGTSGVKLNGGSITISSADDAIHSNGNVEINGGSLSLSTGDDAVHADTAIVINGGTISVAKSYEGIESAAITINNGEIHIIASDDGINGAGGTDGSGTVSGPGLTPPGGGTFVPGGGMGQPGQDMFASSGNYSLIINGGYISVDAGGDGIDVNGSIDMTDGIVLVNGPTDNGNGPLDYDSYFKMTGGLFVATGSSGMAMAPSKTSTQNSVLVSLSTAKSAGTIIHIQNSAGDDILTFAPTKTYQSLAFSSPDLVSGTYEVYLGGSSTGTLKDSLYTGGDYSPGTRYTGFTVSGVVTTVR